jgi:transketolase
MSDAQKIANIRKNIFRMMNYSKSSHIGGALSIVEILYTLYFKIIDVQKIRSHSEDRDIFILSKGHNSSALYSTFAEVGLIDRSFLDRYYIDDGLLPGHLDMTTIPYIECAAGSLGHGPGIGLGMAIAKTRKKLSGHVYVLVGDGECNEGSVWEAIMLASTLKQKNYTLIIDFNHLQGMGRDVISQNNLSERLHAFGFKCMDIDGNNPKEVEVALCNHDGPLAIVAHTIKGKGVSFTEDRLEWHYKSPNDEQLSIAIKELEQIK